MRILLTALIATLFLAGCPGDKKGGDKPAKDTTTSETKPATSAKADTAKSAEGEGW